MLKFAEVFPDSQIVSALMRQLAWTHFLSLIYIADPLKRDFYAEMCRVERWSTRTLQQKIAGMLYERTALSKKPDQLIRQELDALRADDKLTPDLVLRGAFRSAGSRAPVNHEIRDWAECLAIPFAIHSLCSSGGGKGVLRA